MWQDSFRRTFVGKNIQSSLKFRMVEGGNDIIDLLNHIVGHLDQFYRLVGHLEQLYKYQKIKRIFSKS